MVGEAADALAQGGALAVIDRASGQIVGSSRWQGYDPAEGGSVEIGWTFLARSHWGGRYNPELKRLMLRRTIQALAEGRDPGDLTTIEDPTALEQIRSAVRA